MRRPAQRKELTKKLQLEQPSMTPPPSTSNLKQTTPLKCLPNKREEKFPSGTKEHELTMPFNLN